MLFVSQSINLLAVSCIFFKKKKEGSFALKIDSYAVIQMLVFPVFVIPMFVKALLIPNNSEHQDFNVQGGSNMTGTDCV